MKLGVAALAVGWLMWLICGVFLGERVIREAVHYKSSFSCPVPRDDSQSGHSSWGWWPPGVTCQYHGRVFRKPQVWRLDAVVGLGVGFVGLPLATVALARRHRQNADDGVAIDELVGS